MSSFEYPYSDEKGEFCYRKFRRRIVKIYKHLGVKKSLEESFEIYREDLQRRLRERLGKEEKVKSLETFEEQVDYIIKNQNELYEIVEKSNKIDKDICIKLQERNGFNNRPEILNSKDFDDLSDNEYIKVYRGYHDGKKTAEEYIEQFKNGKNEYGTGEAKCGVGHYTITNCQDAKIYGKIVEIKIPKNAKIVEYSKIKEMHYKNFEKYNDNLEHYYNKYGDKVTDILDTINYANTSAVAIMNNIDVIHEGDMYIILNRGIIKIKE